MNTAYSDLYQKLLYEIDDCAENDAATAKQFENCFAVSVRYYEKLKRLALQKGFATVEEEIYFFREIKPKFTALVEFSVIATEALWFIGNSIVCPLSFWKEEMDKYARFCERHHAFLAYFKAGRKDLDESYFLRSTAEAPADFQSQFFDDSRQLDSSKDWLVRSYFAHKMYYGFTAEKFRKLVEQKEKKESTANSEFSGQENQVRLSRVFLQYMEAEDELMR